MTYTLAQRQEVQASQNLDELPDDEFMEMLEAANTLALAPRAELGQPVAMRLDDIRRRIVLASLSDLLSRAEQEANCSHADVARALGVSRQRIGELLGSVNVKVDTLVRFAAACGYETEIVLRPVQRGGPPLTARLPAKISTPNASVPCDATERAGMSRSMTSTATND
jgi:transcriptional regulator with XRE-family HTH domain